MGGKSVRSFERPTSQPMAVKSETMKELTYSKKDMAGAQDTEATKREKEFNTEEYKYTPENKFLEAIENPLSTFSIDVDTASYSNIRRFLTGGTLPPVDSVRIEEMVNYFTYDYPEPKTDEPFSVNTEISQCPWNPKNKLVLFGLQAKKISMEKLPQMNLTFLLDVSGSMNAPNKLPLLKQAFSLLANQLRPKDKVSIVVYAGAAGMVLPPTSGAEKNKIIDAFEKLEAGGSTAGGEGIVLAYKIAKENFMKQGNNRIILATDGDFNVGASSEGELVRMIEERRKDGIFLTVLGFGMGNYKDSKMESLADKGNGNYAYIDNLSEAKKVLVTQMGGTLLTIAKDVKIQVEFNPAKVKSYRLIGYENRMLAKEDFADDKKDAGELGAGHTVTALYEIEPADQSSNKSEDTKYTSTKIKEEAKNSKEVMLLKLRYKKPTADDSILLTYPVLEADKDFDQASNNLRFASTVAAFGMVLKNSEFKGSADFKKIFSWAQKAKGADKEGYRTEFMELVKAAQKLKQ